MTNKQIKALALEKYPPTRNENGFVKLTDMSIRMKERKAYEQGIRAGIKLAKQK